MWAYIEMRALVRVCVPERGCGDVRVGGSTLGPFLWSHTALQRGGLSAGGRRVGERDVGGDLFDVGDDAILEGVPGGTPL